MRRTRRGARVDYSAQLETDTNEADAADDEWTCRKKSKREALLDGAAPRRAKVTALPWSVFEHDNHLHTWSSVPAWSYFKLESWLERSPPTKKVLKVLFDRPLLTRLGSFRLARRYGHAVPAETVLHSADRALAYYASMVYDLPAAFEERRRTPFFLQHNFLYGMEVDEDFVESIPWMSFYFLTVGEDTELQWTFTNKTSVSFDKLFWRQEGRKIRCRFFSHVSEELIDDRYILDVFRELCAREGVRDRDQHDPRGLFAHEMGRRLASARDVVDTLERMDDETVRQKWPVKCLARLREKCAIVRAFATREYAPELSRRLTDEETRRLQWMRCLVYHGTISRLGADLVRKIAFHSFDC